MSDKFLVAWIDFRITQKLIKSLWLRKHLKTKNIYYTWIQEMIFAYMNHTLKNVMYDQVYFFTA